MFFKYFVKLRLVTFLVCLLISLPGLAQPKLERAQEVAFQAHLAAEKQQFVKSIQLYQEAHQLYPDQEFLFAIASIYRRVPNSCFQELKSWMRFFRECKKCPQYTKAIQKRDKAHSHCLATLNVTCYPASPVFLRGVNKGRSPQVISSLDPGKYEVQCGQSTNKVIRMVQLEYGQQTKVDLILHSPPKKGVGWGITGGSVAAFGVGLYLLLNQLPNTLAQRDSQEAQLFADGLVSSDDQLSRMRALDQEAQNVEMWGMVSLSVGAVLLGGALYILWPESEQSKKNVFVPKSSTDALLKWSW